MKKNIKNNNLSKTKFERENQEIVEFIDNFKPKLRKALAGKTIAEKHGVFIQFSSEAISLYRSIESAADEAIKETQSKLYIAAMQCIAFYFKEEKNLLSQTRFLMGQLFERASYLSIGDEAKLDYLKQAYSQFSQCTSSKEIQPEYQAIYKAEFIKAAFRLITHGFTIDNMLLASTYIQALNRHISQEDNLNYLILSLFKATEKLFHFFDMKNVTVDEIKRVLSENNLALLKAINQHLKVSESSQFLISLCFFIQSKIDFCSISLDCLNKGKNQIKLKDQTHIIESIKKICDQLSLIIGLDDFQNLIKKSESFQEISQSFDELEDKLKSIVEKRVKEIEIQMRRKAFTAAENALIEKVKSVNNAWVAMDKLGLFQKKERLYHEREHIIKSLEGSIKNNDKPTALALFRNLSKQLACLNACEYHRIENLAMKMALHLQLTVAEKENMSEKLARLRSMTTLLKKFHY